MKMLRKILKGVGVCVALLLLTLALAYCYLLYTPDPELPQLSGQFDNKSIEHGGLTRTYLLYMPADLKHGAPVVFALHGSMGNPEQMRVATGYGFERLADEHGFAVVYPQGYKSYWNDCRAAAPFETSRLNIDDVGFLRALIAKLHTDIGIDPKRAYAMGISNGGHMAYRLALEAPGAFAAVAACAANLPTDANCKCAKSGKPVSVLIMNGTEDPINPIEGGDVSLFGVGNRGSVLSAWDSFDYFLELNGSKPCDSDWAEDWPNLLDNGGMVGAYPNDEEGGPGVALYVVRGAGHVIPQPWWRYPRLLGHTPESPNGPEEMWKFFARNKLP
jgi:polyhydroxybutyrate depolymerase